MTNQEIIKEVASGNGALKNDGTVSQLNELIRLAFPEDKKSTDGTLKFYVSCSSKWCGKNVTNLPIYSVKELFANKEVAGDVRRQIIMEVYDFLKNDCFNEEVLKAVKSMLVKTQSEKDKEKIENLWEIYSDLDTHSMSKSRYYNSAKDLIEYARESNG